MIDQPTYKVVLADDVAALRRLVRLSLEGSGRFKVAAEAANGREAIDAARRVQPDLVLLDLSMPEMDGLEALPRVLEAAPRSRVAVFSGFNHVRMAPVALRLGAADYLEKGLEPRLLIERLLKIVEPNPTQGEPKAGTAVPVVPLAGVPAESMRVLVFEAEPGAASPIASALSAVPRFEGHIIEASSLAQVSEYLSENAVDVVIIDPQKGVPIEPILVEVLSRATDVPVIACVVDDHQAREASKLGVEDCVPAHAADAAMLERSILYAVERRRNYAARLAARSQARELQRLRELEKAKSQFFNSAAHELGTPLTPIKLQLHLLKHPKGDSLTENQQKSLEILDRNVDRLSRLTQELLDVARLQAGHMRLETERIDLQAVIAEVIESFAAVAEARGIRLETNLREPFWLDGDAKRLSQVLYNLVSNALKFTPAGGHVFIEQNQDDKDAIVLVHDDGIGLSADQIGRLFEPFSQVHADKKALGTGLGLFISRGIVQLHGGRIWCESRGAGRGATFAFTLPKLPVADGAAGAPSPRGPSLHRSGGVALRASAPD